MNNHIYIRSITLKSHNNYLVNSTTCDFGNTYRTITELISLSECEELIMISEVLWKSLVVMPATLAMALFISGGAIAKSASSTSEELSNPVSPTSADQNHSSIEKPSNTIPSATNQISTSIETSLNSTTPLNIREEQPKVAELSQTDFAPSKPANLATSETVAAETPFNQPITKSTAIPPLSPITANSGEINNPENSSPQETNSNAEIPNLDQAIDGISEVSNLEENPLDQVTSVSQLSDVQPTDWAFQALQSLVERYGCIAGYPDGTYRGNRAMTRYEFAAGLNACLERINEIIASNTSNLAKKEDLIAIQKLQEEFAAELATLRGRVDALEARTAELEANQFSTTTKLSGQLVTYVGDVFGKDAGPANNTTLSYQLYLSLFTSFTGKDALIIGMESANITRFVTANSDYPSSPLSFGADGTKGTDEMRLGIPATDVFGNAKNSLALNLLQYSFPLKDSIIITLSAFSANRILSAPIIGSSNFSNGYLSNYARSNPLTAPTGLQSGIGVKWDVSPWLSLDITAGSEIGSADNPSKGLFNGGYGITIRPVLNFGRLKMTGFYLHTYSPAFGIDSFAGSNASKVVGVGPVVANTYMGALSYRITPTIEFGTSVAHSNARALGSGTRGDAEVWTYDFGFTFYDLGKKGNTLGFEFGVQPTLRGTSNRALAEGIGLPSGQRKDRDTGYHFEVYYAHQLTDNITISPGFIWLTAPNHDARNNDAFMGVIRTTFNF